MFQKLVQLLTVMIALVIAPQNTALAQRIPDNTSTRVVVNQILTSKIYNDLLDKGYQGSHVPQFNLLRDNAYQDITYTLQAGFTYQFLGKCDEDCSDLDLRLFDSNGSLLSKDVATDDYPLITYTPLRTRTFTLRVIMASCSTRECWSGVVTLRK